MKETRLSAIKHGCRVLCHDVEDLITTACRGIDAKYLRISTEQENVVTSAETLSGFEEELGHPQKVSNLDILVIDSNFEQQVHISIKSGHAFYRVKGVDPTWTNGRFAELGNILQRTSSRSFLVYYVCGEIAFAAVVALGVFSAVGFPLGKTSFFIGAEVSIFCLAVTLVALALRTRRNLVILQGDDRPPRDWIKIAGLVVAMIGIIMAAIQLVLAIRRSS